MARDDAEKETIEMVAISSVVPLIPNINVGENERLSFHTGSTANGSVGERYSSWLNSGSIGYGKRFCG